MAASNVLAYSTAAADPDGLAESFISRSAVIRQNPVRLIDDLRRELTDSDRVIVNDAGIRSMLLRNYREGLRTSAYGWIDDAIALCTPWGFDPADITGSVMLWHGEKDVFSPVGHSRWLAGKIPGVTAVLERWRRTSMRCPCSLASSTGCWRSRTPPPPCKADPGWGPPSVGPGLLRS